MLTLPLLIWKEAKKRKTSHPFRRGAPNFSFFPIGIQKDEGVKIDHAFILEGRISEKIVAMGE